MGIEERKRRERENLRKSILTAAEDLFLQEGYANVSMRKIAKKIEYSPATIYNYFKNKSDLLSNLVQDYYRDFMKKAKVILKNSNEKPYETLKAYLILYINSGLDNPNHYKLLTGHFPNFQISIPLEESAGYKSYLKLKELLKLCIEKEIFKEIDLTLAAQSIWTSVYGITSLMTVRPSFPWVEKDKLIDHTVNTILNGLKK